MDTNSGELAGAYREFGFVKVPGVLTAGEAEEYRCAALELAGQTRAPEYDRNVFTQLVNVWRRDDRLRGLTRHPGIAKLAAEIAGAELRLWHDQVLIKEPRNEVATEFHQDQPYWPHPPRAHAITAWIALVDIPAERGCMTFIPGSHRRSDLGRTHLLDRTGLFAECPELAYEPQVTVPLKAGDCTFHHCRTAHMATPNRTGDPRVAHAVIYMDAATTYHEQPHVVTDPLGLEHGQPLDGELFPIVR